jgi:UDP-glucose 4-epimerase
MRLLVTGGAGYIGSVVSAQLLAAGHDVVVLDDLSRGHRSAIPAGAQLVEADLCDREAVMSVAGQGFDAAMHFAALALVGESVANPDLYRRVNVEGSRNLLDGLREGGVERLIFSSTCATYGEPERIPIDETLPERPVNPYGATKLEVDRMIAAACGEGTLGATSLRYFNVAGASGEQGEDHQPETHLIPNILRAAAGQAPHVEVLGTDYPTRDGTAVRDYLHVEDLAAAHLLALDGVSTGRHAVYNLGNGDGFSVREVIAAAREVTGAEIEAADRPRRPGDPPALVASSERIRADLGWEARKPAIEDMISDAWAWMQAHPDGYPD